VLSLLQMRMRGPQVLTALRPRRDSTEFVPWKLVTPVGRESCRWQCVDGRWVSLSLGQDDEIGQVVVADSTGKRELVDAYEDALALARHWRRA
jgi:hypothetical protein